MNTQPTSRGFQQTLEAESGVVDNSWQIGARLLKIDKPHLNKKNICSGALIQFLSCDYNLEFIFHWK